MSMTLCCSPPTGRGAIGIDLLKDLSTESFVPRRASRSRSRQSIAALARPPGRPHSWYVAERSLLPVPKGCRWRNARKLAWDPARRTWKSAGGRLRACRGHGLHHPTPSLCGGLGLFCLHSVRFSRRVFPKRVPHVQGQTLHVEMSCACTGRLAGR
jgi:hypothetical protein